MTRIEPYLVEDEPATKAFNARLRAGDVAEFRLPETHRSRWLPRVDDDPLFEEYFLAKDDAMVRGGYVLKQQQFLVASQPRLIGNLYSPISEGIVDSRFMAVGLQLLMHALRRQPFLYCLGMGSFDNPFPRLLRAAGWHLEAIPFFFRVVRPFTFLRNLQLFRRTKAHRALVDVLAFTGLGHVGIRLLHRFKTHLPVNVTQLEQRVVSEFGPRVDALWDQAKCEYSFIAVRDFRSLNRLYPTDNQEFLKLEILRNGQSIGWAVLLDTQMRASKHFGTLRLGSVIDGLAAPGEESAVAWAATQTLAARGVDLMVTNQSHANWCAAFRHNGWLSGPSNFIMGFSPKLTQALSLPLAEPQPSRIHLLRGDGEGPSHL